MLKVASDNLSNNKVASGNFSPSLNNNFGGILNCNAAFLALFHKDVRAVIIMHIQAQTEAIATETELKRVETALKTLELTKAIAEAKNISLKSIPPKAALPLFDKLSLEHEESMYEIWAKLLVSAAEEYNPIQIQYAEILSKIGHEEAATLKTLHEYQSKNEGVESAFYARNLIREYNKEIHREEIIDLINDNLEVGIAVDLGEGEYHFDKSSSPDISLPRITASPPDWSFLLEISEDISNKNSIQLLKNLSLIELYQIDSKIYMILTSFGYNFIETLEKYSISK